MKLKLMQLPHGTNRNRTLRKPVDLQNDDLDLVELNRLFRRFWHQWQHLKNDEVNG